jgi:excisionase family DNA binding protein
MHSKEGLTISQAAEAMGVSPKTIRRRIKKGEIASKLVPGKFGEEYRITELPLPNIQEQTLDTTPTPDTTHTLDTTPTPDTTHTMDTTLALPIIRELQRTTRELHETNLQLAGQLGIAQERIRTLENQVKLLTTGKRPWWKRLFKQKS